MKKNSFINALGLETNKHYFGSKLTNILYKIKLKREKKNHFQANIEGDKSAKYGLAIALLCKSNDKGIQLLLSIINQPDGKQLLQNYRQILQHIVFGTNTFRIPKNQSCKKNGVGQWDFECLYPYGNKELHVICKMCSIDLEMYKLANQVW